jgi:hypothetical protein
LVRGVSGASTNPAYLIIRYLRGTHRREGYYSNRRMREFIKDGTWDATAVPFARTVTHLKDEGGQIGDTGEEFKSPKDGRKREKGHWYSPAELYFILASGYFINPRLAWDLVSYALKIGTSRADRIDLEMVL